MLETKYVPKTDNVVKTDYLRVTENTKVEMKSRRRRQT